MGCGLGDLRDVHGYGGWVVERVLEAVKACGAETKDRYELGCWRRGTNFCTIRNSKRDEGKRMGSIF